MDLWLAFVLAAVVTVVLIPLLERYAGAMQVMDTPGGRKAHDRPLYILGQGPAGRTIRDAPFINHTDQELMLIEALVGRTPPFVFPKDDYTGPRRDY